MLFGVRWLVGLLIRLYQRYLSPLKGYRCAYGICHGGKSCSAMVLDIVRNEPLTRWPRGTQRQFRACRDAHARILSRQGRNKRRKANSGNSPTDCCDPSLACECVSPPRSCSGSAMVDGCDIGACI